jgi:hypothetical protein
MATISQAAGYAIPLMYMAEFSTAMGYSAGFGAILLAVLNGVNPVSRILMEFTADKAGRQNTLISSTLLSAITVCVLWAISVEPLVRRLG